VSAALLSFTVDIVSLLSVVLSLAAAQGVSLVCAGLFGRSEMQTSPQARVSSLDGLRGLLALLVFFQHFGIMHCWTRTGLWDEPAEVVFANMGRVGVMGFFMITGFLFVRRLMTADASIDWGRFYLARVFRIVPLYAFAVALVVLFSLWGQGGIVADHGGSLVRDLMAWAFFVGGAVNGYPHSNVVLAFSDWTLRYEWAFYLSLPLIFVLLRRARWLLFIGAAVALVCGGLPADIRPVGARHMHLFVFGGIVAGLACSSPLPNTRSINFVAKSLILLGFALAFFCPPWLRGMTWQAVLVLPFVWAVCSGESFWGVLEWRSSLWLGELSYGIYLLHGPVLFLVHVVIYPELAMVPRATHLWLMPVLTGVIVLCASLAHRFVEVPGLLVGRWLDGRMRAKTG